tara:strand:+ start:145 stop:282 length:138 start_codon:yes stop_codon:yes gene_type:complete
MAKHMIQSGEVAVNGNIETRRKKKLMAGDKVETSGKVIVVGTDIS